MPSANAPAGFYPQLDGLRAVAVGMVIVHHAAASRFVQACDIGSLGVYLFFVLSGFLITGVLLDARSGAEAHGFGVRGVFQSFYMRRLVRIFPAYYLALLLFVLAGSIAVYGDLWWFLTYTTNWAIAERGGWTEAAHFWTLAVEEQFYMVWPAVILLTPHRWLVAAVAGSIALGPISRLVVYGVTRERLPALMQTFGCLDFLAGGALLAIIWHYNDRAIVLALRRWTLGPAILAALFLEVYRNIPGLPGGAFVSAVVIRSVYAVIFFWVIDAGAAGFGGAIGRLLLHPAIRYIGRISYGIYIYHWLVNDLAMRWLGIEKGLALIALSAVATLAVASLSWFAFEKPINDLKRFFPYAKAPAPRMSEMELATS